MIPRANYGVLHPMRADRAAFAAVESPHTGRDLLRKLMDSARTAGHFRRYFSLRRAWLRAANISSNERTN